MSGSQSGKTCRQAERLDFVGIKRGQIQGNQSAQRPAENVCRHVDLSGESFGNGGNIKRLGKRRIAVSGQIKRADVPIGRQARYQIVEYMAVRRPTVYQINFFGGVWHECSFLVAQFETAQCATLRYYATIPFQTAFVPNKQGIMMKNIVILISGRGSNMQAIVNANIPDANIAAVLSNNETAAGLAWAAERGIATDSLNHKTFDSRLAFDQAMMEKIDAYQPDLIVLGGLYAHFDPGILRPL